MIFNTIGLALIVAAAIILQVLFIDDSGGTQIVMDW